MGSFYDLASRLQETGRQDEATTMSSISYLPTQVGVVRAALTSLGKKKNRWNLEILEGDQDRTVRFEDALDVVVPHEHWDHFQGIFDGQLDGNSCLELPSTILDSSVEQNLDLEGEKSAIHLAVESLFRCPEIRSLQIISDRWQSRLGIQEDLTPTCVLLPVRKLEETIEAVYSDLIKGIEDDRGQLEILSERVEDDPLPDIRKVRGCSSLAGLRVRSVFEGVKLIFEAHLGFDWRYRFSVLVEDADVADKLEESLPPGVGRVGQVFYPKALHFGPHGVPDLLVEAIHEVKGENHEQ